METLDSLFGSGDVVTDHTGLNSVIKHEARATCWLAKLIRRQFLRLSCQSQIRRALNGLAHQRARYVRFQQTMKCLNLVEVRIEPELKVIRPQHQGNAFRVNMTESRVGR